MKLIIDIPEEHYRTLQEAIKNHMESLIGKIVLNGTVLPKGHENCQPSRKVIEDIKAEINEKINNLPSTYSNNTETDETRGIYDGLDLALQIIDKHIGADMRGAE